MAAAPTPQADSHASGAHSSSSLTANNQKDVDGESFESFYEEVKAIEQRDSVLTPKQQIDRLLRPGSTYFNLNPYDVLDIPYDANLTEIKQKYRRMSILVHPDKNVDDAERAQKSFECVNKAYKTLNNEEGFKRCQEIVDEAKQKIEDMIKAKKKQLKKEGKEQKVPEEEDPEKYKHAVYVHMCKLFADLERLRIEKEAKDMHEKKRKAQEDAEAEEDAKVQKEWNKNFEESRTNRVDSWRTFNKVKGKKAKGGFRPPKPKLEKR
ncbi:dnaJ homolog subfamily C member 8-like [Watersipora subatra]|uniref:dnaJ homolog subfamily C member 8-like n=1 Tax=Watersipora subatra TaxID=2589382 RepID=UPI00355B2A8F